jgi:hypothetical protein
MYIYNKAYYAQEEKEQMRQQAISDYYRSLEDKKQPKESLYEKYYYKGLGIAFVFCISYMISYNLLTALISSF